jgi:beta-lactamase superfamily II metal-dependent hydrolase
MLGVTGATPVIMVGKNSAYGMHNGTTATTSYTSNQPMTELWLSADTGNVTITIDGNSWTINQGQVFSEQIVGAPFFIIQFTATGNFRFYGRG